MSQWPAHTYIDGPYSVTIPPGTSGTFNWRLGFLDAQGNPLYLGRAADAANRLTLGTVAIQNETISFAPSPLSVQPTPRPTISIGPIQTNGSMVLTQMGTTWTSQIFQLTPGTVSQLQASVIPVPNQLTCNGQTNSQLDGTAIWDLQNASGDTVASGIYLYLLTDPQGNKTRGKLAIIR